MKQILFGTKNKTRLAYMQGILKGLPLDIVGVSDLDISMSVDETGKNPEENSAKKAKEYHKESNIPTFSIDSGLYIDKFTEIKQPGVFVKRIKAGNIEASDEEMLEYYISELEKCGGSSRSVWTNALTIVISEDKIFSTVFNQETLMTANRCDEYTQNEPLNSIQIDPITKKYIAVCTVEEKIEIQKEMANHFRKFFEDHIEHI